MKKFKKVAALAMAAMMALSMTACGGSGADNGDGAKTYTVGVCQLIEHPALDSATQGFQDALKDKLGYETGLMAYEILVNGADPATTVMVALNPIAFFNALPANVAQGLVWGVMALGLYITFRLLDFADLTVDGSIATGGAVTVILTTNGWNIWAAQISR